MSELRWPDADLRVHPPRPARAMLAGLMFVPRTIDKIRAKLQGTLGFYKVGPGISSYLFEWAGIDERALTELIDRGASDDDVAAWLVTHTDTSVYPSVNVRLMSRGIRDEEHFRAVLPRYPVLEQFPGLRNWFDIFDLDDTWTFDVQNRDAVARTVTE